MSDIKEWLTERSGSMVLFDGFDAALVGVVSRPSMEPCVAYDHKRCLKLLVAQHNMSTEEAEEYFNFNVACTWVGEQTPFILERVPREFASTRWKSAETERVKRLTAEVHSLRNALKEIATFRDEPYCADFARDALVGRIEL